MFVSNWMSSPAVTVRSKASLREALAIMAKRGIHELPVVDVGRLLGIVTKGDLEVVTGRGVVSRRGRGQTVADVMARDPASVAPAETVEKAAQLMLENRVSGVPVIYAGQLVGIITKSDIFRAFCDVMGVRERGARIVLTLGEPEDLLKTVMRRMRGLTLRGLVTYFNPRQGQWEVVLRVRGHAGGAK